MLFRQEPGASPASNAAVPGGFVEERPPPGLARGRYPAPPWAIAGLGAALILGSILYFVLRLRKARS